MGNKPTIPEKVHKEREININLNKKLNTISLNTTSQKQIEKNKIKLFNKIITNYRKGFESFVLHYCDIRLSINEIQKVCIQVNEQYGNIVRYLPGSNYNTFILQDFISDNAMEIDIYTEY